MCMIFIFSSLCSCSKTLLSYCPLASFAKSTVLRVAQQSRAASDQKREANLLQNRELRPLVVVDYHRIPARAHPLHRVCNEEQIAGHSSKGFSRIARGLHREPLDRTNNWSRKKILLAQIGTSYKSGTKKHSICTHFPKDRNCEICKRTKIAKAPCKKRTGDALLRAEKFGDLLTADHKVFNEGCESRNNHRYSVVVQDLATQWIQSYPCKTKNLRRRKEVYESFSSRLEKPKVINADNSLEFGKSCEDLSWNHRTSTPHRSETNGVAERTVRRIMEGKSAVLLQSGWDYKWWADSMERFCYRRKYKIT